MNRTNLHSAQFISIDAASAGGASQDRDCYGAEEASELTAKRVFGTISTLRILVPVALLTAIAMSGRPSEVRIDSAMAAASQTRPITDAAPQNYYPAQFVNQGAGAEEHVSNF